MVGQQERVKDISLPKNHCLGKQGGIKRTYFALDRARGSVQLNEGWDGDREVREGEQRGSSRKGCHENSGEGETTEAQDGASKSRGIWRFGEDVCPFARTVRSQTRRDISESILDMGNKMNYGSGAIIYWNSSFSSKSCVPL